ncbi:hypothetical protein ACFOD9_02260 [Novosphingobium bradum]|uniref:Uncharacterized protein n=1 Tax=Novosphingobium bradum TaxID=1737444 RepID=A0ABV7IN46_9SPHN
MPATNVWAASRTTLAGLIAARLAEAREDLVSQWTAPRRVRSFVLDDLLPPELVTAIHATSFRPERARGLGDLAMRADNALRTAILKLTGNALFRNSHVFRRDD